MASYTPLFKHKNNKKSFIYLCRKVLDAVCTHVTPSAASRDSAVKIMTDSYQFWVASNFSIAYTVCKKSAKNMVMRFQSPLVYLGNNILQIYCFLKKIIHKNCH